LTHKEKARGKEKAAKWRFFQRTAKSPYVAYTCRKITEIFISGRKCGAREL